MCSQTRCKSCGKATWKGCGNHIEKALADVPNAERCVCERVMPHSRRSMSKGTLFARFRGN